MIRLLADEDFDYNIRRGVLRRTPSADIVSVQEVGLAGAADAQILTAAAEQQRAILSHDAATMPAEAYRRMSSGLDIQGLIVVPQCLSLGAAVEDIVLLIEATEPAELRGRVIYLPI